MLVLRFFVRKPDQTLQKDGKTGLKKGYEEEEIKDSHKFSAEISAKIALQPQGIDPRPAMLNRWFLWKRFIVARSNNVKTL